MYILIFSVSHMCLLWHTCIFISLEYKFNKLYWWYKIFIIFFFNFYGHKILPYYISNFFLVA